MGVVKSAQDAIEGKTKEKKLLGTWKVLELSQTVNLKVRALHDEPLCSIVCTLSQHNAPATLPAPCKNIRGSAVVSVSPRAHLSFPSQQEIRHHQSMSAPGTPGTASPLGSTISRNEGSAISTLSNSHVIAGVDRWGVFQVHRAVLCVANCVVLFAFCVLCVCAIFVLCA